MIEFLEHFFGICGESHLNINHIILFFVSSYLSGIFLYYLINGKKKYSKQI
jgi:hypothetical protein